MADFAKLKSSSGKASLKFINEEVAKVNDTGRRSDDRFWSPIVDKAGNGYSVIRFLPAPPDENLPFIKFYDHGFKGPNGLWYIENSLTTLGQADPLSEYNSKLWNSTTDDDLPLRKQARAQKRRLHFISNIYVITDSANPDAEGKVFLFKFGKKIFNKISEKLEPEFVDEEVFNPFDLWEGANFKLKICMFEGYRNYDRFEFERVGPLFNDDERLEKIWKQEYSLKEFVSPSNFKTYDELKEKLLKVLSESSPEVSWEDNVISASKGKTMESKISSVSGVSGKGSILSEDEDEDEDDMNFFQKLAE